MHHKVLNLDVTGTQMDGLFYPQTRHELELRYVRRLRVSRVRT